MAAVAPLMVAASRSQENEVVAASPITVGAVQVWVDPILPLPVSVGTPENVGMAKSAS